MSQVKTNLINYTTKERMKQIMNIYELTDSIRTLQDMLETEENPEVIEEALKGYEMQLEEKAEGYAMVMKNLEMSAKGLKEEAERLTARRKVIENNITRLKKNLEESMILTDKRKFKTKLFSFNIQKNPPSVDIFGKVPSKYLIEQAPKEDKKAIIADLKNGEELDFAKLVQGESLRIR